MLGKRKWDAAVLNRKEVKTDSTSPPPTAAQVDTHDVFRKYFEARFEPLEQPTAAQRAESESSEASSAEYEDGSDWDGISDEVDESAPEVVDHTDSHQQSKDAADKLARKQFMSAKPPSSQPPATPKPKPREEDRDENDETADAANLKNDLALQRLLKESHLLDSASDLNPMGKNRHRALDMRMQSVGSKTSLFEQKKMPMSHRKGIKAKATSKEEKRRQEARENGIILEKPAAAASSKQGGSAKRERGVGGPSVGKFGGGTLRLSKRDIMDIQGPRKGPKGKGKRGRR